TGGYDEDHELAVLDPQIEIIDGDGAVAEMLGDFVELDYRHADDSRLAGTAGEYLLPVVRSNTIIILAALGHAPIGPRIPSRPFGPARCRGPGARGWRLGRQPRESVRPPGA